MPRIYICKKNEYNKALDLCTQILDESIQNFGIDHLETTGIQAEIAIIHSLNGQIRKAYDIMSSCNSKINKFFSYDSNSKAELTSRLSWLAFLINKKTESTKYAKETTDILCRLIKENFQNMTYTERLSFWNKYLNWFNSVIPILVYRINDNSLLEHAYNCMLISKGLLLNSETEIKNLILENGSTQDVKLYNEFNSLRSTYFLMQKSNATRQECDSIYKLAQEKEIKLISQSKEYGDFTRNININWQDIKKSLKPNDIAIEFTTAPLNNDSIIYSALVLKSDYKRPKYYSLCLGKELMKISDISSLIWQPLRQELNNIKNIYFAPAGDLYSIPIESAPAIDGDGIMSDHYNIYRLSSTRELAITNEQISKDAVIYGGLLYDTSIDQLALDMTKYPQKRTRDFSFSISIDSIRSREVVNVIPYLPGTKIEVNTIASIISNFNSEDFKVHIYTDSIGTEASFKALSGTHIRVIHIATHGFYYAPNDPIANQNEFLIKLENELGIKSNLEDKILTRSGLFFAGADNKFLGDYIPEGVEDGILTAQEISMLNFKGLELVTLSACQTGQGTITGEGVFGLQRGFKKAGAKSILMSLWKVDDEATTLLMSEFYKHWISGNSKYKSFELAKSKLRNSPQFHNPYYWAAFILLDSIN